MLFLYTSGCSNIQSIDNRQKNAEAIATQADLKLERIEAGSFLLTTYHKGLGNPDKNLVVYIEGDGNAWNSKYRLSENPTPKNPLTLKLATKDTADSILYIARPCMYLEKKLMQDCPAMFWSSHRYSEEVRHTPTRSLVGEESNRSPVQIGPARRRNLKSGSLLCSADDLERPSPSEQIGPTNFRWFLS